MDTALGGLYVSLCCRHWSNGNILEVQDTTARSKVIYSRSSFWRPFKAGDKGILVLPGKGLF